VITVSLYYDRGRNGLQAASEQQLALPIPPRAGDTVEAFSGKKYKVERLHLTDGSRNIIAIVARF
jgi:hypothetical protein